MREREKTHLIMSVSMEIHKEMGLKERIRIWGLYTILTGDREGQRSPSGETLTSWKGERRKVT